MTYNDLRDWLQKVEERGELKRIDGADWDEEIGTIRFLARTKKTASAAVLFDNIKGYPQGYRVLTNTTNSAFRLATTAHVPEAKTNLDLVHSMKEKFKAIKLIPPKVVKSGPVLENVCLGDDIDLFKFPVPKWHKGDGGRYIGTMNCVVTRDPEEGWVNFGTYRSMISDKNTLVNFIDPGQHAHIHRDKYFARREPMPVVYIFGGDPLLSLVASMEVPWGISEYDYAGGIKGEPLEVIMGKHTGLPIPASAEIAVEAEVLPDETRIEGPYAEYTSYYGGGPWPQPAVRVKSIMHRNDPILVGLLGSRRGPEALAGDRVNHLSMMKSVNIWNQLEAAGIPDVKGVWVNPAGMYYWVIVSIKQRYPGHAKQVGLVASACGAGNYYGRYIIVVDDDINPSNDFDVLWAVGIRSDPERSLDVIHHMRGGMLDMGRLPEKRGLTSKAIIDACIPYDELHKDRFPKRFSIDPEVERRIMAKYGETLFE